MIRNQRGGIISSMFVIPIAVGLMAGFFFLGYYVGKYQNKANKNEIIVPLPDIVSKNLPDDEEFTFYKTLTAKGNKTVSIELKTGKDETHAVEKMNVPEPETKSRNAELKKEKMPELKAAKPVAPGIAESKPKRANIEPGVRYTLQIASYQEKAQADEDVKKLKKQGFAAFVKSIELEGKGKWHRVRLGSFTNRASAERLQKELQAKAGVSPIITIE